MIKEQKPQIFGQPVTRDAALTLRALLTGATKPGGTGVRAAVKGYTVGGKTGTAQKAIDGKYSETDYNATFVGFIPAINPEIAILVTLDTPNPQHTGGVVAAPAFAEIAAAVVEYLRIPPDDTIVENKEESAL